MIRWWSGVALLLAVGCNRPLPLGDSDGGAHADLAVLDLAVTCGKSCCKSNQDCSPTIQYECLPPTEFAGCGEVAGGVMCFSDSDCATDAGTDSSLTYFGPVCDDPTLYHLCGTFSGKACIGGCSKDSDCVGGRICDATKHCVFPPCTSNGDCPANFVCGGTRCQRKSCVKDGDCGGGVCVNGACYDGPGSCMPWPL
jgi:hypothetical protein